VLSNGGFYRETGGNALRGGFGVLVLVGLLVVIASVLGGFAMAGGPASLLIVIPEYVVILGTGAGTMIAGTPGPVLVAIVRRLWSLVKRSGFGSELYLDGLKLQYELFQLARKDGIVAIESHIEGPDKSPVFRRYPSILAHEHAVAFFCDSLRVVLVGSVPPVDLEMMLDTEIGVHQEHEHQPIKTLLTTADSLPGIGIVAAVLGIVVTMQAIAGPIQEIGHHVASALVGTFLGILLSYGILHPLATAMEHRAAAETVFYQSLKAGVVAFAKGLAPIVAVEFARRMLPGGQRPSFVEMERACKDGAKAAARKAA
jgi:chemotaxis protein MotA